jgi:hypothetical protein
MGAPSRHLNGGVKRKQENANRVTRCPSSDSRLTTACPPQCAACKLWSSSSLKVALWAKGFVKFAVSIDRDWTKQRLDTTWLCFHLLRAVTLHQSSYHYAHVAYCMLSESLKSFKLLSYSRSPALTEPKCFIAFTVPDHWPNTVECSQFQ